LAREPSSGTNRVARGNHGVMATGDDSDEAALNASLAQPSRFAVIVERRVDGIYRYLSFRVGDGVAEELTAETFARAFAGRGRYEPGRGSVQAWLYGIATNLARHHRRDERRRMALLARAGAEPPRVESDSSGQLAERLRLAAALATLEPGRRTVVLLVGLGGLTYEETAAILHIPVGTVRSRYSRARAELVQRLTEHIEPDVTGGAVL
jgi:RNA polymerase sigma factor (sigma-70 family)